MKTTYTLETSSALTLEERTIIRQQLNNKGVRWSAQVDSYYSILKVTMDSPDAFYWFRTWLESYTGLRWNQTLVTFDESGASTGVSLHKD